MSIIKKSAMFIGIYILGLTIAYKTAIYLPIHQFELAVIVNILTMNFAAIALLCLLIIQKRWRKF